MDGEFNAELLQIKRYRNPAGKYAYAVLYADEVVGQIVRNANGYGNPWLGGLYTSGDPISAGAGSDIKAVKSACIRTFVQNFDRVVPAPKKSEPAPEPRVQAEAEQLAIENAELSGSGPEPAPKPEPQANNNGTATKADKPAPEPTYCLCGCGGQTKPKSKFLQGHDARAKGFLSRAKQSLQPDYEHKNPNPLPLPEILVNRAKVDVDFHVAEYKAKEILELAEAVGTR